jgi:hypothetical protein
MKAFRVIKNGIEQCTAGVNDAGVLNVIMNYVHSKVGRRSEEDMHLTVGGLNGQNEHVRWIEQAELHVGDQITVQLVETERADDPVTRRRRDPEEERKHEHAYYLKLKKKYEGTPTSP